MSENTGREFRVAVETYQRRRKHRSIRQAILEIGELAGYKRADKLYRYMNGKERPGRDKTMILARIVKRRPEVLWPPKEI